MSDDPKVTRHEIMEERGNRDAFRLCVLILVTVIVGLMVLGIAAWNSRFMLMPIVPRVSPARASLYIETPRSEPALYIRISTPARQPGTPHWTAIRPWPASGVVSFRGVSPVTVRPTCRPANAWVRGDACTSADAGLQQFSSARA